MGLSKEKQDLADKYREGWCTGTVPSNRMQPQEAEHLQDQIKCARVIPRHFKDVPY